MILLLSVLSTTPAAACSCIPEVWEVELDQGVQPVDEPVVVSWQPHLVERWGHLPQPHFIVVRDAEGEVLRGLNERRSRRRGLPAARWRVHHGELSQQGMRFERPGSQLQSGQSYTVGIYGSDGRGYELPLPIASDPLEPAPVPDDARAYYYRGSRCGEHAYVAVEGLEPGRRYELIARPAWSEPVHLWLTTTRRGSLFLGEMGCGTDTLTIPDDAEVLPLEIRAPGQERWAHLEANLRVAYTHGFSARVRRSSPPDTDR